MPNIWWTQTKQEPETYQGIYRDGKALVENIGTTDAPEWAIAHQIGKAPDAVTRSWVSIGSYEQMKAAVHADALRDKYADWEDAPAKPNQEVMLPCFLLGETNQRCPLYNGDEHDHMAIVLDCPDAGFIYICPDADLVKGWPECY